MPHFKVSFLARLLDLWTLCLCLNIAIQGMVRLLSLNLVYTFFLDDLIYAGGFTIHMLMTPSQDHTPKLETDIQFPTWYLLGVSYVPSSNTKCPNWTDAITHPNTPNQKSKCVLWIFHLPQHPFYHHNLLNLPFQYITVIHSTPFRLPLS